MSVKFDSLQAGDVLYDVRKKHGQWCTWTIYVREVDHDGRRALVSWNGNAARWESERYFAKQSIRRNRPKAR